MTVALTNSAFAADTDEVWLVLLTISHADIDPPIRVVNNTENIVSRSETYIAFPFEIALPDSRDDAPPRARLQIDNVSREIAQAVRSIVTAAEVTIEVIRAAAPDTIEASWPNFTLQNVRWGVGTVAGDLVLQDFTIEPYPAGQFSPASFPGLR